LAWPLVIPAGRNQARRVLSPQSGTVKRDGDRLGACAYALQLLIPISRSTYPRRRDTSSLINGDVLASALRKKKLSTLKSADSRAVTILNVIVRERCRP
jgi:hypothetical protein